MRNPPSIGRLRKRKWGRAPLARSQRKRTTDEPHQGKQRKEGKEL